MGSPWGIPSKVWSTWAAAGPVVERARRKSRLTWSWRRRIHRHDLWRRVVLRRLFVLLLLAVLLRLLAALWPLAVLLLVFRGTITLHRPRPQIQRRSMTKR